MNAQITGKQIQNTWRLTLDVLAPVLESLNLQGVLFCQSILAAPWGIELAADQRAYFHLIEDGQAWLLLDKEPPMQLRAGELIFLPWGTGHRLVSAPGTSEMESIVVPDRLPEGFRLRQNGGEGPRTQMFCGALQIDRSSPHSIFVHLPRVLRISQQHNFLSSTLQLLTHEAHNPNAGSEIIASRLIDVLFVQALRVWLQESPPTSHWLGALADPQLAPALNAIHRFPERDWSVEKLAELASLSRSAFATRFTDKTGETPSSYLTRWRMQEAGRRLQAGSPVNEVAAAVGYASEPAFSRAFKRAHGVTPRDWRNRPEVAWIPESNPTEYIRTGGDEP